MSSAQDDEWSQPVWDEGFEGPRRRQLRIGLAMKPIERLHWLEEALDEMRRLCGLARRTNTGKKAAQQ